MGKDDEYINGVKNIITYIGKVSQSTFRRWRKIERLEIIKSSEANQGTVMSKKAWIDDWLQRLNRRKDI